MTKNYIIALLAGLLLIAIFTRSCGNKPQENNYVQDSLRHAITLKNDTITTLQIQFDNLYNAFDILQQQQKKVHYETKIIWKDKPATDSIIHAYSDSETVKRFLFRFDTY